MSFRARLPSEESRFLKSTERKGFNHIAAVASDAAAGSVFEEVRPDSVERGGIDAKLVAHEVIDPAALID